MILISEVISHGLSTIILIIIGTDCGIKVRSLDYGVQLIISDSVGLLHDLTAFDFVKSHTTHTSYDIVNWTP